MNDDAPQEFDMVRMIRDLVKRVSANPITDTTDLDRCIRDHVLAACRTEVRENGCGRIAMWRGHGIERLS